MGNIFRGKEEPWCVSLAMIKNVKTIKDLIDFLYDKDELNIKYDLLNDNCKDFVRSLTNLLKQIFIILYLVVFLQVAKKKNGSSPFHALFTSNNDDSLKEVKSEMSDANEMILQTLVYKCPLSSWQLTPQLFSNHQFVVFETQNWWWSIEKDEARLLIQRSVNLSNVQNFFESSRCVILGIIKGRNQ